MASGFLYRELWNFITPRLGIVIIRLNQPQPSVGGCTLLGCELQWFRVLTHPKQLSKRVNHKTRHWASALQASLPWLLWNMPPAQASSDVAAKITVARRIGKGAVSKISRSFVKWLDSSEKFPSSHCPSKLLSQFLVDHHFAGDMIWHISGELEVRFISAKFGWNHTWPLLGWYCGHPSVDSVWLSFGGSRRWLDPSHRGTFRSISHWGHERQAEGSANSEFQGWKDTIWYNNSCING